MNTMKKKLNNTKEYWKEAKGFENYFSVSNFGRLKSDITGHIYKSSMTRGYFYYRLHLRKFSINVNKSAHRIVAETFIENQFNKPQVNHKDGNKLNNNVDNLEWCTQSENITHAFKTKLMSKPVGNVKYPKVIIDSIRKLRDSGLQLKVISNYFNIPQSTVTHICLGTRRI